MINDITKIPLHSVVTWEDNSGKGEVLIINPEKNKVQVKWDNGQTVWESPTNLILLDTEILFNPYGKHKQVGGDHYSKLSPEPWDLYYPWELDFFTMSAISYISRWKNKGGVEDLRKAIHYLEKRIEIRLNEDINDD